MKNKLSWNMLVDLALLVCMALVSLSGFITKVVMPCRHSIRQSGAKRWADHICGLSRHEWSDIHLWTGILLVVLLVLHMVLHLPMIRAYVAKHCPGKGARTALTLFLLVMLLITVLPWVVLCF